MKLYWLAMSEAPRADKIMKDVLLAFERAIKFSKK